ncbi:MAG: tetratricopeptide repeat protein [Pseudomonadota bacterium]|nr:tetratricopeptide repeat protein [Pseudomonadota bacterium]
MPKKPAKKKSQTKPRPEPGQIKAIERLLEDEDYTGAVRRIKPLVQRFPDHGGLRRALVEALEQGEGPCSAGLAAFEWAERRPNSLPAQEALLYFAVALHHVMLADRTARRVRELGGDTPGFPVDPALKEGMLALPDGTLASVEDMERFDIGKLHLEGQGFAGALRWLEGVDLPPARNNRALALFHLDRIDEALDAFIASWQADPDNLFALGWTVRLRLYRGDDIGARGLCIPLTAATARRLDDALPQLDALLLLQQDQPAWDAFERSRDSEWFDLEAYISGAILRHFGACAASRLGRGADARRLWQAALEEEPNFIPASTNLGLFDRDGKAPSSPTVFDHRQALPITWTAALYAGSEVAASALDALTASNAYLEALYISGDQSLRILVRFLLKHRAEQANSEAVHCLKELARLSIGTKEERFGLLSFLREQGLIARDEPVEFWDGGQLRQVKVTGTEIYREAKDSGLPADLDALLGEAVVLQNDGRPEEAEARLNRILQRVPDHPVALGNLSAIRGMQGRPDEALRLLRQVVAQHPDYLFARCNLAKTLIVQGETDEAEHLLEGLADQERLHIQEVFTLYGTMAMLHKAKGEDDMAQSLLANLESMVEDEEDARRLAQVKRSIDLLDPGKRFKELLGALVKSGPKPNKRGR